ncbi:MAG: hypothetical protein D6679_04855 [Candidatus Hydrogenedentota bacterium]|nr:MAG: hypothetical protein D6679_04855 [Candidatus Hydrogenedentota bacterium]
MKRFLPLLSLLLFSFVAARILAPALAVAATSPPYVPGQVIVKYRPGAGKKAQTAAAKGFSILTRKGKLAVLSPRTGQSVPAAVAELSADPDVEFAQPNYLYHAASVVPNDPELGDQFTLRLIDAFDAWEITRGSTSETIAIVDSGADTDHIDLAGRLVYGEKVDIIDNDNDPNDTKSEGGGSGHGTEVAGVAGAITNNGVLLAGTDWNAPLLPVRVLSGEDAIGTSLDIETGIRKAVALGARVINLSLGFEGTGGLVDNVVEQAIVDAVDAGVIVVAAAGNDQTFGNNPTPIDYPASSTNTIAVGTSTSSDALASFSKYGQPTSSLNGVDVVAPGQNVKVLKLENKTGYQSGTSFSAPVVSAAATLLRSLRPNLSPDQFLHFLRSTADDIGEAGFDEKTGAGRVNLRRLLSVGGAGTAYPDSFSPVFGKDTGTADLSSGGRQSEKGLFLTGTDSNVGFAGDLTKNKGTIQFYFKPFAGTQPSDTAFLLTQRGNLGHSSGNLDLILRSDSKVEYRLTDSGTLVSTTTLNDSQWYHIAVTYGDSGMILYINGESEASNGITGGPPASETLYVGAPVSLGGAESARGVYSKLAFAGTQVVHFPSALFLKVESQASASVVVSSIDVGWKAYQSETNAITIDIYADTDRTGRNGVLLAQNLENDEHETLDLSPLTVGQTYYIFAVATDATTTAFATGPEQAFAYSAAPFTVSAPSIVNVGGSAGSPSGGCLFNRLPPNSLFSRLLSRLRRLRDRFLSNHSGRFVISAYYAAARGIG